MKNLLTGKRIVISLLFITVIAALVIYFAFPGLMLNAFISMERISAGLTQKSITVDDHKIVYLEGGSGETLLLIHGFGGDKDNWTRFAKHLTSEYHVVIPDLPGFGESSRLKESSYDIKSQVRRVDALALKLGLDKFHIAGNSMGGNITGVYSSNYPKKVRSLTLFATGGITSPVQSEFRKALAKGENRLVVKSVEDFDRLMDFVLEKRPFVPGPLKKYFAEQSFKNREFNEKVMGDLKENPSPLEPLLKGMGMPVLIIWGKNDRVLDVSSVSVLEKGLHNYKTHIIEDCGHIPMLEMPELTAEYYLDFLQKN